MTNSESRETVEIPVQLFDDLIQVASWYSGFKKSLERGETKQNHPDWNSVEYLHDEAKAIYEQSMEIVREKSLKVCPTSFTP